MFFVFWFVLGGWVFRTLEGNSGYCLTPSSLVRLLLGYVPGISLIDVLGLAEI